MVSRSEVDMLDIRASFQKKYRASLYSTIQVHCSGERKASAHGFSVSLTTLVSVASYIFRSFMRPTGKKNCNSPHSQPLDVPRPLCVLQRQQLGALWWCRYMLFMSARWWMTDYWFILNALFSEMRLLPCFSHQPKWINLFSRGQMFRQTYCRPPVELSHGHYE